MAFTDVIDDYATGATGTLTTGAGETVGYTVVSGVETVTFPNTDEGGRILNDGSSPLQIDFDVAVSGLTLTFDRSNSGEVYQVLINGSVVDLNNLPAGFTATLVTENVSTGGAGTHIITSTANGGGISSSGGFSNDSIGFLTITGPIDSIGVTGTGNGSGFDIVEVGIDSVDFDVLCFVAGTQIATPDGFVDVDRLVAGDQVTTADGMTARVALTQSRHFSPMQIIRETRLSPVSIKAGALGRGLPTRDLSVSRQHRIVVASRIAKRMFGNSEVLVPAIHLAGLPGIDIDRATRHVDYHHILLAEHDVVIANGAPAETLLAGPVSRNALEQGPQELTVETISALSTIQHSPARPMLDGKSAKKLVAAHAKHNRPLLEEWHSIDA